MQAGLVSVAIAIDEDGVVLGDPAVDIIGLPNRGRNGEALIDIVVDAVSQTLGGLSRGKLKIPRASRRLSTGHPPGSQRGVGQEAACHVQLWRCDTVFPPPLAGRGWGGGGAG